MMDYIEQMMQEQRDKQVRKTGQLTLGQLIAKVRDLSGNNNKLVYFDFSGMFPIGFDSWRGIYKELAINYSSYEDAEPVRLSEFIDMCESAVGAEFYGYKGGEYIMNANTPIWVDNYGSANNTALFDVIDNGYQIILITGYCEPYED